jgi:hypothetical protein
MGYLYGIPIHNTRNLLIMPDLFATPVPCSFSVAVIVGFQEVQDKRWVNGHWKVTGVVAGDQVGGEGIHGGQLHAATQGQQYLWTGLSVELHKDDAESYYFNLVSDHPSVFIICTQEEGAPPRPCIATLSYGEATSYMETDDLVESVAMPAELYRWAEQFVLEHYVPEKRKKRKRENWKEAGDGPRK